MGLYQINNIGGAEGLGVCGIERLYHIFKACGMRLSTDSRRIVRGGLFFALRGDNFDGNHYAAKALESGAAVAVVDDVSVSDGSDRYFVVENSLVALQCLAVHHRRILGIPIVALTGSNGKTTTKEFLRLALGVNFRVGCTEGNFNNHIGVPLTLLSFTDQTEIGIVEMGANHCGEIDALCGIARPNVGLITNVGRAHLDGFGSVDGVRRGKGELYDYLRDTGGTAIYNADDEVLSSMIQEREGLTSVPYYSLNVPRLSVNGLSPASLFGQYNVYNAMAAVKVAEFFGVNCAQAIDAVYGYVPHNNRSEIAQTVRGNTLVVDCYNANPSSMAAAIGEFKILASDKPKVMILGHMRELGEYSVAEHRTVIDMVGWCDELYFVGSNYVIDGVKPIRYFDTVDSLHHYINIHPLSGRLILIKGSRVVQLERIIDDL
ncbi:MAG: UDP-N-acetylmuramoyl-tripeptide--D-alanyl-D-alanine ligase [Mucinivorans sp.]